MGGYLLREETPSDLDVQVIQTWISKQIQTWASKLYRLGHPSYTDLDVQAVAQLDAQVNIDLGVQTNADLDAQTKTDLGVQINTLLLRGERRPIKCDHCNRQPPSTQTSPDTVPRTNPLLCKNYLALIRKVRYKARSSGGRLNVFRHRASR